MSVAGVVGLLALAGTFAVAAVWRPHWLAAAAIVVAPLHVYRRPLSDSLGELGGVNVSLFRILIVAAAVGLVVRVLVEYRRRHSLPGPLKDRRVWVLAGVLLAFAAYTAYEAYRGITPLAWTLGWAQLFLFGAAGVLAAFLLLGYLRWRTALIASAISAIPVLLYTAIQVLGPGSAEDKYLTAVPFSDLLGATPLPDQLRGGGFSMGQFRPAAYFSDPNFLAVYLVGVTVIADLLAAQTAAERPKRLVRLLQLACIAGVAVTLSRTGLIMLIAFGLLRWGVPVIRRLRRGRPPRGRALVLVSVGLLAATAIGWAVWQRSSTTSRESTASHIATIQDAVDLGADFPIIGAGLGNYGYVYGQPPDRSSAQSTPFTIFAEEGVVGLLLFGSLVVVPVVLVVRRTGRLDSVPLAILVLVGPWLYDYVLALDVSAVWLALLLAAPFVGELQWGMTAPAQRSHANGQGSLTEDDEPREGSQKL